MTDLGVEALRAVTPEGELWGHTWTPQPKPTSRWWRAGELAAPRDGTDHYVSMGLTEAPGSEHTRAKADEVTALLAVAWADVDIATDWHGKDGLATSHDEAFAALTAWSRPTVALRTPGGVQGFWLAQTAVELEPPAMAEHLRDVGATFRAHSDVTFDPVWNADRLMRLPGSTHYGSGEPLPVVTEWADGPWYDLDGIGAMLVDGSAEPGPLSAAARAAYLEVRLRPVTQATARAACPAGLVEAVEMIAGAKWSATWRGERPDLASASEHDMAVASWAAQVDGIDDDDIAQLVAARRAASGAPEKSRLVDYLRRTIARARSGAARDRVVAHAEQAATAAAEDIVDAVVAGEAPPDPLRSLSLLLGVPVDRVVRRSVPDAPASSTWHIVSGGVVSQGFTAAQTGSAAALRGVIVASFGKVPPRSLLKPESWDMVLQVILDVAEPEVLSDEADPVALARAMLRALAERTAEGVPRGHVPHHDGQPSAWLADEGGPLLLRREWLLMRMRDAKVKDADYATAAQSLGWVVERRRIQPVGRTYCWVAPLASFT